MPAAATRSTPRSRKRVAHAEALWLPALLAVAACRDPTQVTVAIQTNVPCDSVGNGSESGTKATVIVSRDSATLEDPTTPITTDATFCEPFTKRIGSLVVLPNEEEERGPFALRVASAVKADPETMCP